MFGHSSIDIYNKVGMLLLGFTHPRYPCYKSIHNDALELRCECGFDGKGIQTTTSTQKAPDVRLIVHHSHEGFHVDRSNYCGALCAIAHIRYLFLGLLGYAIGSWSCVNLPSSGDKHMHPSLSTLNKPCDYPQPAQQCERMENIEEKSSFPELRS